MAIPLPTGMRAAYRAAYRAERATATPKPRRTPLLVHAGRAAARLVAAASKVRRNALILGGFGSLDYAAYQANHIAGWAAVGASLLVAEFLSGGDE